MDIADIRKEYTFAGLRRADLHPDPIHQFKNWFQAALSAGVVEPNAMTLATVDASGQPSSRIVLLKDVDDRGFTFYTNYESRKGRELAANSKAALTMFWPGLERMVCVRGATEKLGREESEIYFKSRPIGSRLGAWVSSQSTPIPNREYLENKLREVTAKHGENPPIPPYWGGFVLRPATVEFWQGRPSRLHDRFLYTKSGETWKIDRLSP
ncbi:MAG TPA: pyridoxamine 5'-phosphate oxidase [Verrucomicrobiae bacterium]